MLVNDTSILTGLGSGLASVDVVENSVKLSFKNGATFTLTPQVEEDRIDYTMDYVTGKENKQIERLQKKINALEDEMNNIKINGSNSESDSDEEDIEDSQDFPDMED
ncbi:MAG: hypothetical protein K0R54_525 [Clostridiaceae bacterium]|jgi:hypothetical protein|nr:hypothetical protein [Clostridiaceae bacterium]